MLEIVVFAICVIKLRKRKLVIINIVINSTKNMISFGTTSVEQFYDYLIKHVPGLITLVIKLGKLMNGHSIFWYKMFMFCGIVIPRVIVATTLLIEVCYFHQVYLFYYLCPLAIIPLLVKALVGILINTYENNIKGMHNIVFNFNALDGVTHEPITVYAFYDPEWNENNLSEEEKNIDYFVDNVYLPILGLYDTAAILHKLRVLYTYRVIIYIVPMYSLSGIYLLLATFVV
jgi:hypothetical protein